MPVRLYRRATIQIPMTALIDIVFLLLIYFLLTTNFLASDILPLELPAAGTAVPQQIQVLTISVKDTGEIYLDNSPLSDKELSQRLEAEFVETGSRAVIIRSDRRASLDRIVTILDIVRACGADQISLATTRSERQQ